MFEEKKETLEEEVEREIKEIPEKKPEERPSEFPERRFFKGNWKCSQCGIAITELPFEPDDRPLYCQKCYRVKLGR